MFHHLEKLLAQKPAFGFDDLVLAVHLQVKMHTNWIQSDLLLQTEIAALHERGSSV